MSRKGGAAARMMLVQAAANGWKVPASECVAANSVITHKASKRHTTYGKVAKAAAKVEPPKEIKLKDPKDWKIVGKGLKRLDTPDKTQGKTVYGIDIRLPGMLYAAIKACPVVGGKVKSFDAAKIAGCKGVKKVVRVEGYAVAVVADSWWRAKTALDALPIVWDEGDNAKVSSASIAAWLKEGLDVDQALVGNKGGDVKAALASAAKKVEAVYAYPYQNHAPMERYERHRALYRRQMRGVVLRRRTAKPRLRRRRRRAACRPQSAKSTRRSSAADSAAVRPERLCASGGRLLPKRFRARRSSCSGRAKRTCSTAGIIRSRNARLPAASTRTTT